MAEFPTYRGDLAIWRVQNNPQGYGRVNVHRRDHGRPPGPLVCLKCGMGMDRPHRDGCPTLALEREILRR